MIIVAVIAAVTSLLITILVCATIQTRPTSPCFLKDAVVFVGESRIPGGTCSGKAENVYVSTRPATEKLDGARACNGHVTPLQSIADALVRESA